MKFCVISSFPPKHCGIAEFNQDLMVELLPLLSLPQLVSVAINEGDEFINSYPVDVRFQIRKNYLTDYLKAADFINSIKPDVVLLQHEFGLFGGYCGKYALDLIQNINKPIICILHTIPIKKYAHKPITKKIFFLGANPRVKKFIVIAPEGKTKLVSYGISPGKITIISHGAPDISTLKSFKLHQELNLTPNDFIVFSFGLLHPRKGLDYAILAMKDIARKKINCRLVIYALPLRGKDNEAYFLKLKSLIRTLHLEQHIFFKRAYLSKEQLYACINACDVGILPYTYKSYISSGVLSFFSAALKPVITTHFPYADYLLNQDSTYFVPNRNSRAITEGIIKYMTDKSFYQSVTANLLRLKPSILWKNKAKEYLQIINEVISSS